MNTQDSKWICPLCGLEESPHAHRYNNVDPRKTNTEHAIARAYVRSLDANLDYPKVKVHKACNLYKGTFDRVSAVYIRTAVQNNPFAVKNKDYSSVLRPYLVEVDQHLPIIRCNPQFVKDVHKGIEFMVRALYTYHYNEVLPPHTVINVIEKLSYMPTKQEMLYQHLTDGTTQWFYQSPFFVHEQSRDNVDNFNAMYASLEPHTRYHEKTLRRVKYRHGVATDVKHASFWFFLFWDEIEICATTRPFYTG